MANKVDFPEFERFLGAIGVDGSYRVVDVLVKLISRERMLRGPFPIPPKDLWLPRIVGGLHLVLFACRSGRDPCELTRLA